MVLKMADTDTSPTHLPEALLCITLEQVQLDKQMSYQQSNVKKYDYYDNYFHFYCTFHKGKDASQ